MAEGHLEHLKAKSPVGKCKTLGTHLPDDQNCRKFYLCMKDANGYLYPSPVYCGHDEVFDPIIGLCKKGHCGECHLKCEFNGDIINDRDDCNIFHHCIGNGQQTYPENCPPDNPYYDSVEKTCQSDVLKCCLGCKKPNCPSSPGIIAISDPEDCRSYYLCTGQEGLPSPSQHHICPNNHIFDEPMGKCKEGSFCENICQQDTGKCVDNMICYDEGTFPKCEEICFPEYFVCKNEDIGQIGTLERCNNGLVFDPQYHQCIQPEFCSLRIAKGFNNAKCIQGDVCLSGIIMKCPNGMVFNTQSNKCIQQELCSSRVAQLCPDGEVFDLKLNLCILSELCS